MNFRNLDGLEVDSAVEDAKDELRDPALAGEDFARSVSPLRLILDIAGSSGVSFQMSTFGSLASIAA